VARRTQVIHSDRFVVPDFSVIESFRNVLLDLAKKDRKEPEVRPVQEYDSDPFAFVNRHDERMDKDLSAPPNLIENRKIHFFTPEEPVGRVENYGQPASGHMISRDEILHTLRGCPKSFHFGVTPDCVSDGHEHALELFFETSIQIRLL